MHDMQVRGSRPCQQAGLADGSVGAGGKVGRGNNLHLFNLRQSAPDIQASIVRRRARSQRRSGTCSVENDITSSKYQTTSQKEKIHDGTPQLNAQVLGGEALGHAEDSMLGE
jgi:hypothetical protein